MNILKGFKFIFETDNQKENLTEGKDKESKRQYLQFIQDIITRHNTNSFQIKQFAIAIIVAVFGVFVANGNINPHFILIPVVTTLFLSFLDTIYLLQEKQYRELFKNAIKDNVELYDMNASKYKFCFFEVFFTKTIMTFYIPLIVANLLVYCFLFFNFYGTKLILFFNLLTRGFNG